jgi:hypothetical protein
MRDLQPFVGTTTLAYLKGALNEADPLCRRRLDSVSHAPFPSHLDLRRKFQPLSKDAQLISIIVNALRLSHEFVDLVREGIPKTR